MLIQEPASRANIDRQHTIGILEQQDFFIIHSFQMRPLLSNKLFFHCSFSGLVAFVLPQVSGNSCFLVFFWEYRNIVIISIRKLKPGELV